jgi:hypothetical protein
MTEPSLSELKGLQGQRKNAAFAQVAFTARAVKILIALLCASLLINGFIALALIDARADFERARIQKYLYRGLVRSGSAVVHSTSESRARNDARRFIAAMTQARHANHTFAVPWSPDRQSLADLAAYPDTSPFFDEVRLLTGTRHTAHGTRHTAHGTRHTAHGTRHTAHGTR